MATGYKLAAYSPFLLQTEFTEYITQQTRVYTSLAIGYRLVAQKEHIVIYSVNSFSANLYPVAMDLYACIFVDKFFSIPVVVGVKQKGQLYEGWR